MKKSKNLLLLLLVWLLFLSIDLILSAGCGKETEIKDKQPPVAEMKKPGVTGIREFHEVLYPVWYSYFPQGDFKSIRNLIPEFKKLRKYSPKHSGILTTGSLQSLKTNWD